MYYFWLGALAALIFQEITDWKYTKQFLMFIGVYALLILFASCHQAEYPDFYPCEDGNCNSYFEIDSEVSPGAYKDINGYWHVKFNGTKYFTVKGQLDRLHENFVVNDVPLVEVAYDTDYWIWIDNITFQIPVYSAFGLFSNSAYTQPIPIGNITYTMQDLAKNHPPLNIAGYQITDKTCMDCAYTPTLFNTYSKYTYRPRHMFNFIPEMVGDTATVFIKAKFNTDLGMRIENDVELKVIFE